MNSLVVSMLTFVVSPDGSGDGSSEANSASYVSTSFWTNVQNGLSAQPVTVIFKNGNYEQPLPLPRGIGHPLNKLTLQSETVRGAVFIVPDDDPPQAHLSCEDRERQSLRVDFLDCTNLDFKGFLFTGQGTIGYVTVIRGTTNHLTIENSGFEDMPGVYFGATGTSGGDVHHITIKSCQFRNIGCDAHAHMMYNANDSRYLRIVNCTFEDCSGDYVRFRNNVDRCVVQDCTFISNGDFPVSAPSSRAFVAMPLFNDCKPGSERCPDPINHPQYEYFGTSYVITGNRFVYLNHAGRGDRNAVWFYHSGFDPPGKNHLMTAGEGNVLENGSRQDRMALLRENCGIDTTRIKLYDNREFRDVRLRAAFSSHPNYGAVSKGWEGTVDIEDLVNKDPEANPPRWLEALLSS